MKAKNAVLSVFLFLSSLPLAVFAGPPTAEEVKKDILSVLVMAEITHIRMTGLDIPDIGSNAEILDLASIDLGPWGEPGCFQIGFRVYWTATEDVYMRFLGGNDSEEVLSLVRCGRKGHSYAEKWDELTVERKTEKNARGANTTRLVIKKKLGPGKIEWDVNTGLSSVATKSCWEAQAAVTGETLTFFEAPNRPLADPSSGPSPDQVVRIELKSRPLDFVGGGFVRTGTRISTGRDAARHDHVFVYDRRGKRLDGYDVGWSGNSGEIGETFQDAENEGKYGPPVRTIEMPLGEYTAAREAFLEQTKSWRYELANAAMPDVRQAARGAGGVAGETRSCLVALLYLQHAARRIVSSGSFSTPMMENDVPEGASDEDLASVDPALRACYPGVNCQLWADQFFEYLEYVKAMKDNRR